MKKILESFGINLADVSDIKNKLAEAEAEMLEMDSHALYMALMEGFAGWNNISDDEVIEKYTEIWGSFDG